MHMIFAHIKLKWDNVSGNDYFFDATGKMHYYAKILI